MYEPIELPDVHRQEMRRLALEDDDTDGFLVGVATQGLVDVTDLYWLLGVQGVMAPRSAWLLVGMWAHVLPEELSDCLGDPSWWKWFDRECGGP